MKHLHIALLYWMLNHEVLFRYAVTEYSSWKLNEIMKLSKKFSHRSLCGMFRLMLLFYSRIMKKCYEKIYVWFKELHGC